MLAPQETTLKVRDPILVVVDMQVGFLNEHSLPVIPSVLRLFDECNRRSLPIIFTKFINRSMSAFELFLNWTQVRYTPEIELYSAFVGLGDSLVEKSNYTAFTDEFKKLTLQANCRTLLISGISTESCVLKTALDAFELGIRPVIVSDACASDQGTHVHLQALELMKILIGRNQIMTIDELVLALDCP